MDYNNVKKTIDCGLSWSNRMTDRIIPQIKRLNPKPLAALIFNVAMMAFLGFYLTREYVNAYLRLTYLLSLLWTPFAIILQAGGWLILAVFLIIVLSKLEQEDCTKE